jgi:hypothetical protein
LRIKIRDGVMGGECSMRGRDEKCILNFWLENLRRRDLGIDRKIVLEWRV